MRDKMMSILGSLDSESLVRALGANGIKLDGGGSNDPIIDGLSEDKNRVEGWKAREIKLKPDNRPKLLQEEHTEGGASDGEHHKEPMDLDSMLSPDASDLAGLMAAPPPPPPPQATPRPMPQAQAPSPRPMPMQQRPMAPAPQQPMQGPPMGMGR